MRKWLTIILWLLTGAGIACAQSSFPPTIYQNQGSNLGVASKFNCSTGTTCTLAGGTVAITSSGGGAVAPNQNVVYVSPNCGAQTNCYQVVLATWCLDATTTHNSQTVTSAGGCTFTASMVGQSVWGFTFPGFQGLNQSVATVPLGTVTAVNSSSSITVSDAGSSITSCSPSGSAGCSLVIGTDQTTAINAAWAAAAASCSNLEWPTGALIFSQAILISDPTGAGLGCLNNQSYQNTITAENISLAVYGHGLSASLLIPEPGFSFTSCTGGSGNVCVGGVNGVYFHDFSINGLGYNATGTNGVILVQMANGGVPSSHFGGIGWAGGDGSAVGIDLAAYTALTDSMIDSFGTVACKVGNGGPTWLTNTWCSGRISEEVLGSTFQSGNTIWLPVPGTAGGVGLYLTAAANFVSSNDWISDSNSTASHWDLATGVSGVNANFTNLTITPDLVSGSLVIDNASGSSLHFRGLTITTGGANRISNAGSIYDDCGNNFGGNTISNTGSIFGSCSQSAQTSAATAFGSTLTTQAIALIAPTGPVTININLIQSTAGSGCGAGTNTVTPTLAWTGPGGTSETLALSALSISANGTLDSNQNDSVTISAEPSTEISYTTASTLASTGCSTTPKYTVYAKAIQ